MKPTLALLPLAALTLCCGCVLAAPAGSVTFDGDLGCDTLQTQRERWSALKVMYTIAEAKLQGIATPELLQLRDKAAIHYSDLSRDKCRHLDGPFKMLERETYHGATFVRVGFGSGSLWVLLK